MIAHHVWLNILTTNNICHYVGPCYLYAYYTWCELNEKYPALVVYLAKASASKAEEGGSSPHMVHQPKSL